MFSTPRARVQIRSFRHCSPSVDLKEPMPSTLPEYSFFGLDYSRTVVGSGSFKTRFAVSNINCRSCSVK